jgi:hypothetical protein
MDYTFPGYYVWDTWFLHHAGETHVFGIQKQRHGRQADTVGGISHAVSTDLLEWETLPDALAPGQPGDYDDMALWTGCTVEHQGRYHLFYTARCSRTTIDWRGRVGGQTIALATSDDLVHWTKHLDNPVISVGAPLYCPGDCRDLCVVRDEKHRCFWGYFASGLSGGKGGHRGVTGLARSVDLVHWEVLPPAFSPAKYVVVEVPDVFFLNGLWYMIMLTGTRYAARETFDDPLVKLGTVYAVSDRPEGPFVEPARNTLLGSIEPNHGFSARTVEVDGVRCLFYTEAERSSGLDGTRYDNGRGRLTTPKLVEATSDGRLSARYWPGIERRAGRTLLDQGTAHFAPVDNRYEWASWKKKGALIEASYDAGYDVYSFDAPSPEGFIYAATMRMEQGRSVGLVFHETVDNDCKGHFLGSAAILDFARRKVLFANIFDFQYVEERSLALERDRPYRVVVVARREFYEVYVDDELMVQLVRYEPRSGRFGLFIEDGRAAVTDLLARELDLGPREY